MKRINWLDLSLSLTFILSASKSYGQPSASACATTSTGKQVCVRFDNLSSTPGATTDYAFDLTDPDNPKVQLLKGRNSSGTIMEWRIWCTQSTMSSTPANIGEIKADTNFDFDVKIRNPSGGFGADMVGLIDLTPSGSDKYSRLTSAGLNSFAAI